MVIFVYSWWSSAAILNFIESEIVPFDPPFPKTLAYMKISIKSVQLFSRNVADKEISIAASRGLSKLTENVIRSSYGHSTPSLKISCKSVQPFTRNVADKEISIAASRGLSELNQKCNQVVPWSLHTFPENYMQIGPAVFW